MIKERIGAHSQFVSAMESGYFDKEGMTKYESVFVHDYEDLVYQMSLKRTLGI